MKKRIFIPMLALFSCIVSAAPQEAIVWNTKNDFAGWNSAINARLTRENGNLVLADINRDCRMFNGTVQFDPAKYICFAMRYKAKGTGQRRGQLYFAGPRNPKFSERCRWSIPPLVADGQWHTLFLTSKDMPDFNIWKDFGSVTSLRLDPTDSPGGRIEISELRFEKKEPPQLPDRLTAPFSRVTAPLSRLTAPVWPDVKSELWVRKQDFSGPYFQGKMIRSPEDRPEGGKYSEFFLRKTFTLKTRPKFGWLQFTGDDRVQAFVNGKNAGIANDWKRCSCVNVSRYLKQGKNLLAFHYYNLSSYGGVLAELYVQYADGRVERIDTDRKFRSTTEKTPGWSSEVDFNDTRWQAAIEQAPPPAAPWMRRLKYHYFSDMQNVVSAEITPKKVTAGKNIHIRLECEGKMPSAPITASLVLKDGPVLVWREDLQISQKYFTAGENGRWILDFPYEMPLYLNSHRLQASLESDMLAIQPDQRDGLDFEVVRISHDPKLPARNRFRVVRDQGAPYFELNGKPFWPIWMEGGAYADSSPINLVTAGNSNKGNAWWWPRSEVFNTAELDIIAEKLRRKYPDALFMWSILCSFPVDWAKQHPNEMCHDENGQINRNGWTNHSFSSKKAMTDFEAMLSRIIPYLEKSPYANRIVGYRIIGGYTTEWLGWQSRNGLALDFSPPARQAFADLVKAEFPELPDGTVPKTRERRERDGSSLLWDQRKHLRAIAYNEFISRQSAQMMLQLCRKARELVGPDKVIGSYYGYTSTLHYTGVSQYRAHYSLKRVLDAGAVDFLMSPNSYPLRNLGETCGEMKPFASLGMNGIIPVCENDTRTHNAYSYTHTPGGRFQTVTEKHTLGVIRRNMGIDICRRQPNFFLPILPESHELDFPSMTRDITTMRKVAEHCLEKRAERKAETVLVVSEESIKSMPPLYNSDVYSGILDQRYDGNGKVVRIPRKKTVLTYESFIGNLGRFNRSGALVDQMLAEDLADHPGNYKLYVFVNCYKFDDRFLQGVSKLRQRKCTLLWLYAPGYIKGLNSSTGNMKELTGISFVQLKKPSEAVVKFADGRLMGTPSAKITPMFAVVEQGAEILGRYPDSQVGAAAIQTGPSRSIFCGAWQLDLPFINDLMDQTGIFRYSRSGDPLDANDSLVVIHARSAGEKNISLPRKTDVLDIYEKRIVGRNTDRIQCVMNLHETKSFYYGDDADVLLKKLMNQL